MRLLVGSVSHMPDNYVLVVMLATTDEVRSFEDVGVGDVLISQDAYDGLARTITYVGIDDEETAAGVRR